MARYNRGLSLRPVRSEKHEVSWTNLGQNASATQSIEIIKAVDAPTVASQVSVGATVKSVFFETNLNGVDNSGTVQVFHWLIFKDPGDELGVQVPSAYNAINKKFILHRGMEMLPEIPIGSGGTVQTKRVFVVKIPPRLRRFDLNDALKFNYISTSASGINYCGLAIFKEFS